MVLHMVHLKARRDPRSKGNSLAFVRNRSARVSRPPKRLEQDIFISFRCGTADAARLQRHFE